MQARLACALGYGGIPNGIAVVAGLAVLEAQLLKRFGEDVFAGHVGRSMGDKAKILIHTSNHSTSRTDYCIARQVKSQLKATPSLTPAWQPNLRPQQPQRSASRPHLTGKSQHHFSAHHRQHVRPLRPPRHSLPALRAPVHPEHHPLRPAPHIPVRRREPGQCRASQGRVGQACWTMEQPCWAEDCALLGADYEGMRFFAQ